MRPTIEYNSTHDIMFISFRVLEQVGNGYKFQLIDTDFTVVFTNPPDCIQLVACREYKKRNLPVAKNIALVYRYLEANAATAFVVNIHNMELIKNSIDRDYPELEYGAKYYNCILNELKKLQFINKK